MKELLFEKISRAERLLAPTIITAVLVFIYYCICRCIYNIYFHPLRKIPGPTLAVMWSAYEFYYDVLKDGTYLWKIQKMHQKYGKEKSSYCSNISEVRTNSSPIGPIIRTNPGEIHVQDPEFYTHIYTGRSRKVDKDSSTVAGLSLPLSVVSTVAHNLHRSRRGYMNPYFSKRAIVGLEPMIHERISRLCIRLEEALLEGKIICLNKAFSALTADIITMRFYGQHFDYLGVKSFKSPVTEAFLGVSIVFHLNRFLPSFINNLQKLPIPVIRLILPSVAEFLELQREIKRTIMVTLDAKTVTEAESKSVIVQALGDERIPAKERTLERLMDEGTVVIVAGTETTSKALTIAMFHLLDNKSLAAKLRDELNSVPSITDDAYSLSQLEQLPFLTGVVNECLRLSYGPACRLPRVATKETLQYRDYAIPPGYPVSQSTLFVHTDPSIYPDPYSFNPERWVKAAREGVALNKYLVSFSKGSRQCIAIVMAYAELYLTIARVIRKFDMDLYNTTVSDH